MRSFPTDTVTLIAFKRNARQLTKWARRKGQPVLLTVNGEVRLVVQDVRSYARLLDALANARTEAGILAGLDDVARGRSRPASDAFAHLRAKYHIPDPPQS